MGIVDMLKKMERIYNMKLNPDQIAEYKRKLSGFDDVAGRIYDHVIEHDQKMPTIASLIAYGFHFREAADKARHEEQRRTDEKTAKAFFDGSLLKDNHGKIMAGLVLKALTGDMTRGEYIFSLKQMGMNTDAISAYYEDHNLPLNEEIGYKKPKFLNLVPKDRGV